MDRIELRLDIINLNMVISFSITLNLVEDYGMIDLDTTNFFFVIEHVAHSMNKVLKPNITPELYCAYQLRKLHKLPITNMHIRSTYVFDIIHVGI